MGMKEKAERVKEEEWGKDGAREGKAKRAEGKREWEDSFLISFSAGLE